MSIVGVQGLGYCGVEVGNTHPSSILREGILGEGYRQSQRQLLTMWRGGGSCPGCDSGGRRDHIYPPRLREGGGRKKCCLRGPSHTTNPGGREGGWRKEGGFERIGTRRGW